MKLTQKYAIIQLIEPLDDGFEFGFGEDPLHVTLADVFAVDGDSSVMVPALRESVSIAEPITAKVVGTEMFGPDRNVQVKLVDRTEALVSLHEQVVEVLQKFNVQFNNPEFTLDGFKPHSTVQKSSELQDGDEVVFNALTLIDMFPDDDGYRRRVIATISIIHTK